MIMQTSCTTFHQLNIIFILLSVSFAAKQTIPSTS